MRSESRRLTMLSKELKTEDIAVFDRQHERLGFTEPQSPNGTMVDLHVAKHKKSR